MSKAQRDFSYVDVPAMLNHYSNPSENWRRIVLDSYRAEVTFYKSNNLIRKTARAWNMPIEETVINFSEFTDEGQKFIMSLAVEKWRQAQDRGRLKNTSIDSDGSGLDLRLKKFRSNRTET